MKKKITAVLLCILMALSLAACKGNTGDAANASAVLSSKTSNVSENNSVLTTEAKSTEENATHKTAEESTVTSEKTAKNETTTAKTTVLTEDKTTVKETTTKNTTTTKNQTTTKKETTTSGCASGNHSMGVGNIGKWFNSRSEVQAYVSSVMESWNNKHKNGEITWEEYTKNCPSGYKAWSCSSCGKWTGDLKYF